MYRSGDGKESVSVGIQWSTVGWIYSDCDEPSQVSHEGKRWACCLITIIGDVLCVNVC